MSLSSEGLSISKLVKFLLVCLIIYMVFEGVASVWTVIYPFALAGVLAYAVMPMVSFVQNKLRVKNRAVSVFLICTFILGFIYLSISVLIPSIESEVNKTLEVLSQYKQGQSLLRMLIPDEIFGFKTKDIKLLTISQYLKPEQISELLTSVWEQAGNLFSSTISIFSWGLSFTMGVAYFVFILLDFEGLAQGFRGLFPKKMQKNLNIIGEEFNFFMSNYFRGQLLVALSVTILLLIGFNLIGLPLATAMAIIIGLLNLIPYMQLFGILPLGVCAILMSVQTGDSVLYSIFLAYGVLAIVQIIQDTIIVPNIMGNNLGMRPSLILLVLSVWGYLLGLIGMIIALPISMLLYSIYCRYVLKDAEYIEKMNKLLKINTEE